jgi:hypothetical protein
VIGRYDRAGATLRHSIRTHDQATVTLPPSRFKAALSQAGDMLRRSV